MKTRVAINGFGRIGRNSFRVAFDRDDIEIVAINDLTDSAMLAYLLKYDTNYGPFHHEVSAEEGFLIVNGTKIPVTAEKDPANLPWADRQVDVVIESTGFFTTSEKASAHIKAGAKKVVISAPAKDEDTQTVVLGANEHDLESYQGDIISNASCTTNSLSAVMDVLDQEFGVEKAMLTTVHSYTASQALQDGPAKDKRESRAAAENIVPTTTGAAIAVAKTVPSLVGKFDGMSVRVPTPVVSLSDVTMVTKRDVTIEEVNEVLKRVTKDLYYQGIIDYTEEELVSSDYIGNSHSGTVDGKLTNVVDGNLVKVVIWYDNEWGYSNRLVELVADVGNMIHTGSTAKVDEEAPAHHAASVSAPAAETVPASPVASSVPVESVSAVPTPSDTVEAKLAEVAEEVEHMAPTEVEAVNEVAQENSASEMPSVEAVGPVEESVESEAEESVESAMSLDENTTQYKDLSMAHPEPEPEINLPAVDPKEHPVSVAYDDLGNDSGSDMKPHPEEPAEEHNQGVPPPPPEAENSEPEHQQHA